MSLFFLVLISALLGTPLHQVQNNLLIPVIIYVGNYVVGQIPVVQLNFAALSNETPFNRDTVESCVKEVLQALSRSVHAKRNVEFHFAGIGRLSIRESKVKMKFFKEFLRCMDGSGSLVHALSNVSLIHLFILYQFWSLMLNLHEERVHSTQSYLAICKAAFKTSSGWEENHAINGDSF